MYEVLQSLLNSKKFTAVIIGVLATFLAERFGLPEDQVTNILNLLLAYIVGQGVADAGKEYARINKEVSVPDKPSK